MHTRRQLLTASGALSLCGLLLTGPALSATHPCQHAKSNWTGATVNGNYSTLTAKWRVPKADCSASRNNGLTDNWIGFGKGTGWQDPLNQIGTSVECKKGKADYWAWWEQHPASPVDIHGKVRPGDRMTASVSHKKDAQDYRMVLRNKTQGWHHAVSVAGPPEASQAEIITELHEPAALTSPAKYTDVKVNGHPLAHYRQNVQMESAQEGGVCVDAAMTGPSSLQTTLRPT